MEDKKKAVSPIVSTLLLVMIVIILAIIILLWGRGFIKEAVSKEINGPDGPVKKTADKFCLEIFQDGCVVSTLNEDGSLAIENHCNIPIYAFQLKLAEAGSGKTITNEISSEKKGMINVGSSTVIDNENYNNYESIEMIPMLLGQKDSSSSPESYLCSEKYAVKII